MVERLLDRYEIVSTLGKGGMSTVYLAHDIRLNKNWAIKVVDTAKHRGVDYLAEPNLLKNLDHPALPRIVDIERQGTLIYIVEDYISGQTIEQVIDDNGKIPEAQALDYAKELCGVLRYLHGQKPNPIIYRDMKPSNVMITEDNHIKLIDFGIAREYKTTTTQDTTYIGTRGYAAPEQYGTAQTDARTDIYSLGVTLYHMLTGKSPNEPPYELLPVRRIDPGLSEGIEHIIQKMVQADPQKRYQNVDALLDDIGNVGKFSSHYRRQRGKRIAAVLAFCALYMFFAGLVVAGGMRVSEENELLYKEKLANASVLVSKKQWEEAAGIYSGIVAGYPDMPDGYLGNAWILYYKGEFARCIQYIQETVPTQVSTAYPDFTYLLGACSIEISDYVNAVFFLERAYNADNVNSLYVRDYIIALARSGDIAAAKSIANAGTDADDILLYVSGEISLASGEFGEAADYFNSCLAISDDDNLRYKTYVTMATMYKDFRGQIPNATDRQIEIIKQAKDSLNAKDDIILTELLAEAYFTAQQYVSSREEFERLLSLGYKREYIYRNLAIIEQQLGDYEAALSVLQEMSREFPDSFRCYIQLSFLQIDIESQKDIAGRNYSAAYMSFKNAYALCPEENYSELQPLEGVINDLISKGWILEGSG